MNALVNTFGLNNGDIVEKLGAILRLDNGRLVGSEKAFDVEVLVPSNYYAFNGVGKLTISGNENVLFKLVA